MKENGYTKTQINSVYKSGSHSKGQTLDLGSVSKLENGVDKTLVFNTRSSLSDDEHKFYMSLRNEQRGALHGQLLAPEIYYDSDDRGKEIVQDSKKVIKNPGKTAMQINHFTHLHYELSSLYASKNFE